MLLVATKACIQATGQLNLTLQTQVSTHMYLLILSIVCVFFAAHRFVM